MDFRQPHVIRRAIIGLSQRTRHAAATMAAAASRLSTGVHHGFSYYLPLLARSIEAAVRLAFAYCLRILQWIWPPVPPDRLRVMFANRIYDRLARQGYSFIVVITLAVLLVLPCGVLPLVRLFRGPLTAHLSFYSDYHILFMLACLAPAHTVVVITLWRRLETTFQGLIDSGQLTWDPVDLKRFVTRFNYWFNFRILNVVALILAALMSRWLVISRSMHMAWWGSPHVDSVGFWFILAMATVVWYQLFQHNFKGIVAVVLMRSVFRRGVRLQPFHSDGVYGLGNIAALLLLAYATTVIHCLAILTLWSGKFFTTHDLTLLLVFSAFFIVFVPVFFAIPSIVLRRATLAFKDTLRHQLRRGVQWPPTDAQVFRVFLIDHVVDALPGHPFSRRIMIVSASGYLLQLVSALISVFQMIKLS